MEILSYRCWNESGQHSATKSKKQNQKEKDSPDTKNRYKIQDTKVDEI